MNAARSVCTAAVLFVGTFMPASAQRDGREDKPGNREDSQQKKSDHPQGKPDKRGTVQQQRQPDAEEHSRPNKNQEERQQPERVQRQDQPIQQPQQRVQQQTQPQQTQPQRAQYPAQQQQRVQQQPQQHSSQSRESQLPQRTEQQARAWQQNRGWIKQGAWQGEDTWQHTRAQRWYSEHRTWEQRGGYGGYYIPQNRFSLNFGTRHLFRLASRPVIYQGYPRFDYAGFSFLLVDPWPEYWAENWYDANDLYIDYDDGYYLYNRDYNQVRLAIAVLL